MGTKKEIVKADKLTAVAYKKPIGFTVVLVILVLLLKSMEYGRMESFLTIISILIIIVLIPLNQIFRIKRIHIYNIIACDNLIILYQDLLRDKKIEVPVEDIDLKVEDTSIRGCSKLELILPGQTIQQYCNKVWSNEKLREVKSQIDDIKKRKQP